MNFKEYLIEKKIDPSKFAKAELERFKEFQTLFNQIHPESFTQQKLFLINQIRRKYKLEESKEVKKPAPAKAMRPKIKPLKPKTS